MEDFFEEVESRKQAWPAGRADLHWHIRFDPAVLQEQLAGPYREITHRPGLAPVDAHHPSVRSHGGRPVWVPRRSASFAARPSPRCTARTPGLRAVNTSRSILGSGTVPRPAVRAMLRLRSPRRGDLTVEG